MGLALSFDKLHQILYIRLRGGITNEGASEYYTKLSKWFVINGTCSNIFDFSDVTDFQMSTSEVRKLAANAPPVSNGYRNVIVAPQDVIYGLSRMYETLGGNMSDHVHVVRTIAEAYQLLGVKLSELDFQSCLEPL